MKNFSVMSDLTLARFKLNTVSLKNYLQQLSRLDRHYQISHNSTIQLKGVQYINQHQFQLSVKAQGPLVPSILAVVNTCSNTEPLSASDSLGIPSPQACRIHFDRSPEAERSGTDRTRYLRGCRHIISITIIIITVFISCSQYTSRK